MTEGDSKSRLKKLNYFGWAIATFAVGICSYVLICPDSEFAQRVDKFQTLLTGMTAGLGALVSAWIVYNSAKLPVDREKEKTATTAKALKTAGAATLYNAIHAIELGLLSEAATPNHKRRGKLLVPEALPSLDVIKTQDVETVRMLSDFFTLAGVVDTHNVLGTWPFDPNQTHPDEKKILDKLTAVRKTLNTHLERVVAAGGADA